MKALVVNGSATERTVFSAQLTWLGLESETASTADEALDCLRRESFVAMLLAWELQGSDGIELLRRIRAEARWSDLPILLITDVDDATRIEQAHDAGASEYLLQPSDQETLLEKLLLLGVDPETARAERAETPPATAKAPRTPDDPEARRAA
jgi:two-component system chemotaxis response regulator CheY